MERDAPRKLRSFFEDRAGSALRSVGAYRPGDVEFVFLRDDLRSEYTEQRGHLGSLVALSTEIGDRLLEISTERSPLSEYRGTVHVTEEAYVLHVPLEEGRGVLVTLDRAVEHDVGGLLHDCERLLYD